MPEPREVAASQCHLNEIAAELIRMLPGDRKLAGLTIEALREHTWAAGFAFQSRPPPHTHIDPAAARKEIAVLTVKVIQAKKASDAAQARAVAYSLKRLPWLSADAAALTRQHGYTGERPALVYLITHNRHGAAKVGVSDVAGTRLARHQQRGWQLTAAFQVPAKTAIEIETKVLCWWRGELGLPSFLNRAQMPQGGWTETVDAARIDLAVAVTLICQMAVATHRGPK
jgi:hypothetical protein